MQQRRSTVNEEVARSVRLSSSKDRLPEATYHFPSPQVERDTLFVQIRDTIRGNFKWGCSLLLISPDQKRGGTPLYYLALCPEVQFRPRIPRRQGFRPRQDETSRQPMKPMSTDGSSCAPALNGCRVARICRSMTARRQVCANGSEGAFQIATLGEAVFAPAKGAASDPFPLQGAGASLCHESLLDRRRRDVQRLHD